MPAKVDLAKCNGYESCIDECPSEAISIVDEKALVDVDVCIECGVCIDACPEEAIGIQ